MLSLSTRPASVWPSVVCTVLRMTTGGAVRESGAGATGPFGAWASAAPTARTTHDAKISVFMVPKPYQVLRRRGFPNVRSVRLEADRYSERTWCPPLDGPLHHQPVAVLTANSPTGTVALNVRSVRF